MCFSFNHQKDYSFFSNILWCLILSIPYLLVGKRKYLFFVIIILVNLILLSHVWYFRTYFSLIPISSVKGIVNLPGLGPSVFSSIYLIDALIVLPTIFIISLYYLYFRHKVNSSTSKVGKTLNVAILTLSYFLLFPAGAYILYNSKHYIKSDKIIGSLKNINFGSRKSAARFGLFTLALYQLGEKLSPKPVKEAVNINPIYDWLRVHEQKQEALIVSNDKSKSNLVIILVESLESWPINSRINSQEITPYINSLIDQHSTIYVSNVVPQTHHSHSSDAQLILNTGLLPVRNGTVFFEYTQNRYYTLAEALKDKANYSCYTLVGGRPFTWNQNNMNPSLGFDGLFSIADFKKHDLLGLGLSDVSFFAQAFEKIKTIKQPFYLQMLTLSSHKPFKIPKDKVGISVPANLPTELGDYIRSVNYTDKAIGNFMNAMKREGLFDNTVFVITGDHEAFNYGIREQYLINKQANLLMSKECYVPFLIINAPEKITYNHTIGQIDIYPTLLDIMQLSSYPWKGLGSSILSGERVKYAVNVNYIIIGDTLQTDKNNIKHTVSAWEISNSIIKSNFFDKDKDLLVD